MYALLKRYYRLPKVRNKYSKHQLCHLWAPRRSTRILRRLGTLMYTFNSTKSYIIYCALIQIQQGDNIHQSLISSSYVTQRKTLKLACIINIHPRGISIIITYITFSSKKISFLGLKHAYSNHQRLDTLPWQYSLAILPVLLEKSLNSYLYG